MERKIHFGAGVKLQEDGSGWLEGYGSTFGNVDSEDDVIEQGAFKATLPGFIHDGFMPVGHNWGGLAVATIQDAREDDHGLLVRAQFHSTPEAQNARTVVRERLERGKSVGLSIGYAVPPTGAKMRDDGVRVISRIDLYEVSIVTVPANEQATVTGIKDGRTLADESATVLAAVAGLAGRLRSHAELRTVKEGRTLSAANRARLGEHRDALRSIAGDIHDLLVATAPDDGKATGPTRAAIDALYGEFALIESRLVGALKGS